MGTVNENSLELPIVGAAKIAAADDEDDVFSFKIVSPHDKKLELTDCSTNTSTNPDLRTCKIKPKVELDHEAQDTLRLRVQLVYEKGTPACRFARTSGAAANDYADVRITVLDVDEPGTVELSPDGPRACTELTAVLTDPDEGASSKAAWTWARASARGGTFTAIAGATADRYTATGADVGKFLKATVTYRDIDSRGARNLPLPRQR